MGQPPQTEEGDENSGGSPSIGDEPAAQETTTATPEDTPAGQSPNTTPPAQQSPSDSSRNEESVGQPPQTEEGDENSGGSPPIGDEPTAQETTTATPEDTPAGQSPNTTPPSQQSPSDSSRNEESEDKAPQIDEGEETNGTMPLVGSEPSVQETQVAPSEVIPVGQSPNTTPPAQQSPSDSPRNEESATGKGTEEQTGKTTTGKKNQDKSEQSAKAGEIESGNEESATGMGTEEQTGKTQTGNTSDAEIDKETHLETGLNNETEEAKTDLASNQVPKKILLSEKSLYEGQKAGTVVGQLIVIAPDDPKGNGSYKLELVSITSNFRRAGRLDEDIAPDPSKQSSGISKSSETKLVTNTAEASDLNSSLNASTAELVNKEKEGETLDNRTSDLKEPPSIQRNLTTTSDDIPFSIDEEGRLQTTRVLDYETCEFYPIRIRATDESGKSVEIDFVIQVKNAFVPIVRTGGVSKKKARRAMVTGKVLADGYSPIEEVGVVVSKQPRFARGDNRATVTSAENVSQRFEVSLIGLEPGTTYYFRSYAANGEGTSYGALKNFTTAKSDDDPWTNSESGGNGWLHSNWLGNVYQAENGWIYHQELGWLYAEKSDSAGVWLYSRDFLGWFWTGPEVFPFVYASESSTWVYYHGILADHRAFFHFGRSSWMTFPKSGSTKKKDSNKAADGKSAEKQSTAKDSAARQASESEVLESTAEQ
ncbi:MAG: hypothetical protein CMI32_02665 [Opitutales bacterium]|nr:hypothetical protein [Opitutales bacterium]